MLKGGGGLHGESSNSFIRSLASSPPEQQLEVSFPTLCIQFIPNAGHVLGTERPWEMNCERDAPGLENLQSCKGAEGINTDFETEASRSGILTSLHLG